VQGFLYVVSKPLILILNLIILNIFAEELEISFDSSNLRIEQFKGEAGKLFKKNFVPEGTVWNDSEALTAENINAFIEINLFSLTPIEAIIIQADANDSYIVECDAGNRKFKPIWFVPPALGKAGIAKRFKVLEKKTSCSRIKIRPGTGDNLFSVARVRLFRTKPDNWEALTKLEPAILKYVGNPAFDMEKVYAVRMLFLLIGLVVLHGYLNSKAVLWRWLAVFCCFLSLYVWNNAGRFHLTRFFHAHDVFHYYMGSKYSPELSYNRLYRCLLLALKELNIETPSTARNLDTNLINSANLELRKSRDCKQRFSPQRWEEFKSDLKFFSTYHGNFGGVLGDHGYNPTPFWNMYGYMLSNFLPATETNLNFISFLDLILMSVAFLLFYRAFGLASVLAFMLFWSNNDLVNFGWIGGSYLRSDWLAFGTIGLCLLKLKYEFLGFVFLFLSAGARFFPGLFIGALVIGWSFHKLRNREIFDFRKLIAAGLLVGGVWLAFELKTFGGFWHVRDFIVNLRKHSETFSSNIVGTKVIASYGLAYSSRTTLDQTKLDHYQTWKEEKERVLREERRALKLLLDLSVLLLWLLCLWRLNTPYEIGAVAVMPVFLKSLANYDLLFLGWTSILSASMRVSFFNYQLIFFGLLTFVVTQYFRGAPYDEIYFGFSLIIYLFICSTLMACIYFARRDQGEDRDSGLIKNLSINQ